MVADARTVIEGWADAPDISARSVLVTIFGDTILPVTNSFWLAQLFQLTEALGFNDRLIRTSMFRLAAEDWLTNERVGRQSRYTLTPLAVRESEQASFRIYHQNAPDWSGSWTLVMFGGADMELGERQSLTTHLQWNGFFPLGTDLMVSPADDPGPVTELLELMDTKARVAVATAEFVDLAALVDGGFFAEAFNTEAIESDYRQFIERYEGVGSVAAVCSPLEAFAIRTILVHDLRRIRLRAPDIPADLLPENWAGHQAYSTAAELYHRLSPYCAEALSEVLEVSYPETMANRF